MESGGIKRVRVFSGIALIAFIFFSRFGFRSAYLYSWDSINYALSLELFNVALHRPHPPGYILYSFTLRVLNWIIQDANLTMILLNIAATAATCFCIIAIFLELNSGSPAPMSRDRAFILASGIAFLYTANPVTWFYGCIAEIYAVEGLLATSVAYLVILAWRKPQSLVWASAALAIAGGFRPTTEVFLFPFYLSAFAGKSKKTILISLAVLVAVNAAWLIWLLQLTGLELYWKALSSQGANAAVKAGVLAEEESDRGTSPLSVPILLIQALTIPFLLAIFIRLHKIRIHKREWFLFLLLVPPIAFYVLIHFAKDGYILLILPFWLILAGMILGRQYQRLWIPVGILIAAIAINCGIFLNAPAAPQKRGSRSFQEWVNTEFTSPNLSMIRTKMEFYRLFFDQIESRPGSKFLVVQGNANPNWRFLMYYLPQYRILALRGKENAVAVLGYKRIFGARKQPVQLTEDQMIVIASQKPEIAMAPFQVKKNRYYSVQIADLPRRFTVYNFPFTRRRE